MAKGSHAKYHHKGGVTTRAMARRDREQEEQRRATVQAQVAQAAALPIPTPQETTRAQVAEAAALPIPAPAAANATRGSRSSSSPSSSSSSSSSSPSSPREARPARGAPRTPAPDAASPPATTGRSKNGDKKFTKAMCDEFIRNPRRNPLTKAPILIGKATYKKLVEASKRYYAKDELLGQLVQHLIQGDYKGALMCANMLNTHTSSGTIKDIHTELMVPVTDASVQQVLARCKDRFRDVTLFSWFTPIIVRDGHTGVRESLEVPILLAPVFNNGQTPLFRILNMQAVIDAISLYIYDFNAAPSIRTYLDTFIQGLDRLLKSKALMFLDGEEDTLLDLLMELTAMKEGLALERSDDHSNDSSPLRESNRSKSLSAKEGVSPMPKKKRAEILAELENACIEMRDMITLNSFEDDMKKKDLQLVIAIGPKNVDGKQRCYHVRSIYDHIKNQSRSGVLVRDPITRAKITDEEVRDVIMPKMRHLDPAAMDPRARKDRKYPNMEMDLRHVLVTHGDGEEEEFYKVILRRIIGKHVYWERTIGYIPANIVTTSVDVNSSVVIAKIRELFDAGRLLDPVNNMPRVHLNKSISYWDTERVKKLVHMLDELNNY